MKYNILIDSNDGRFGNQLYPIFVALSFYEHNKDKFESKIYFKNIYTNWGKLRIDPDIFELFTDDVKKLIDINIDEYNKVSNETSNNYLDYTFDLPDNYQGNLKIQGYCQCADKIDTNVIRKYFNCPEDIKSKIFDLYGDISNKVCLHIRRGDYVNNPGGYILLSKQYCETIIERYFNNIDVICVSDDCEWCRKNLSNIPNIIFADTHKKILSTNISMFTDFYIPTLTKYNVCSPSSFCMSAAMLNPNNNMYICYPYYTNENLNSDYELSIIPEYAHKIDYELIDSQTINIK